MDNRSDVCGVKPDCRAFLCFHSVAAEVFKRTRSVGFKLRGGKIKLLSEKLLCFLRIVKGEVLFIVCARNGLELTFKILF